MLNAQLLTSKITKKEQIMPKMTIDSKEYDWGV